MEDELELCEILEQHAPVATQHLTVVVCTPTTPPPGPRRCPPKAPDAPSSG
jgi:hypothetical protein